MVDHAVEGNNSIRNATAIERNKPQNESAGGLIPEALLDFGISQRQSAHARLQDGIVVHQDPPELATRLQLVGRGNRSNVGGRHEHCEGTDRGGRIGDDCVVLIVGRKVVKRTGPNRVVRLPTTADPTNVMRSTKDQMKRMGAAVEVLGAWLRRSLGLKSVSQPTEMRKSTRVRTVHEQSSR